MQSDRACQFAIEIHTEDPSVRAIVVRVGKTTLGARADGSLFGVGLISQPEDSFPIIDIVSAPYVRAIEQFPNPRAERWFGPSRRSGTHTRASRIADGRHSATRA